MVTGNKERFPQCDGWGLVAELSSLKLLGASQLKGSVGPDESLGLEGNVSPAGFIRASQDPPRVSSSNGKGEQTGLD